MFSETYDDFGAAKDDDGSPPSDGDFWLYGLCVTETKMIPPNWTRYDGPFGTMYLNDEEYLIPPPTEEGYQVHKENGTVEWRKWVTGDKVV